MRKHRRILLPSLSTQFLLAFALIALLGIGTVALVANRVTTREFTLYVSRGGQRRAERSDGVRSPPTWYFPRRSQEGSQVG